MSKGRRHREKTVSVLGGSRYEVASTAQNGTLDCDIRAVKQSVGICATSALMFRSVAAKLGKTLA
jgi:hypothetical protein